MGLFDFSSQKWKRELLHHQGWDTVTWVQQLVQEEDEEKEMSRTGCRKGVSTSLGSKFLPSRAEISSPAAMQHQHVPQLSCGCTRSVCGACAGYQLSARSWTCHRTCVPCGTGRVLTALLPALSLWFSLPRAKILQFSVSHQLESCCVYFNHPQLLILSPASWSIADCRYKQGEQCSGLHHWPIGNSVLWEFPKGCVQHWLLVLISSQDASSCKNAVLMLERDVLHYFWVSKTTPVRLFLFLRG